MMAGVADAMVQAMRSAGIGLRPAFRVGETLATLVALTVVSGACIATGRTTAAPIWVGDLRLTPTSEQATRVPAPAADFVGRRRVPFLVRVENAETTDHILRVVYTVGDREGRVVLRCLLTAPLRVGQRRTFRTTIDLDWQPDYVVAVSRGVGAGLLNCIPTLRNRDRKPAELRSVDDERCESLERLPIEGDVPALERIRPYAGGADSGRGPATDVLVDEDSYAVLTAALNLHLGPQHDEGTWLLSATTMVERRCRPWTSEPDQLWREAALDCARVAGRALRLEAASFGRLRRPGLVVEEAALMRTLEVERLTPGSPPSFLGEQFYYRVTGVGFDRSRTRAIVALERRSALSFEGWSLYLQRTNDGRWHLARLDPSHAGCWWTT